MKLEKILNNIDYKLIKGSLDTEVSGLYYDSRKVTNGSAFICLSGTQVDGHDYIESAIEKGATTIIIEKDVEVPEDVTVVKLPNTRKNLSLLAINYFDNPASKLTMIGITGTKGKTTTSWMIKNILEEDGHKTGVIGTMGVFIGNTHYDTVNTTPESYDIQKYLKEMVDDKVEYAIMIIAFIAMVAAYFVAVINRNFIKASMPWTEEVAMYSMIYMALLGTEVGLRDGTQVAVTAIIEKLHGVTKKVVSIVEQIVLEVFTAVMLKAGTALFLKQIQTGQTTPVLKIPMSAMYFSLVLTFGLILLIQTVILVEKIIDLKNKEAEA